MIWHGKHSDEYFDASTPEAHEESARKLLETWIDPNYPWLPEPEDPMKHIEYSGIDLEQANLTNEQIAALPTETLRKEAQKHKTNLARRISQCESEKRDYELIKKVVAGERPLLRWRKRRDTTTDEEWLDIIKRVTEKFPDAVVEGDRVLRPASAVHLLQGYSDGEYMGVEVVDVEMADV